MTANSLKVVVHRHSCNFWLQALNVFQKALNSRETRYIADGHHHTVAMHGSDGLRKSKHRPEDENSSDIGRKYVLTGEH